MIKEQKELIKQGYSMEEAVDISRYNFLLEKYQKQGFSYDESEQLAKEELKLLKSKGV